MNSMEEAAYPRALVGARERPAHRLMVERRLERVRRGHDPSAEWKSWVLCASSVVGRSADELGSGFSH